jgi:hypothetical protein
MTSAWLIDRIAALRALGFFQAQGTLDNGELTARLVDLQRGIGAPFGHDDPFVGAKILVHDEDRVWFKDMEADVCEENNVYAATLNELAQISRGAFVPRHIVETWESESGPIRVEFTHDGAKHAFEPEYEDDWLVLDFLEPLNALLPKGISFVSTSWDQRAWIAAVTPAERATLSTLGVPLK